jgi:hypothetical protein
MVNFMSNAKQFERKNITISKDGLVLRNGIARVSPKTDDDTGLPYFNYPDRREPNGVAKRYIHVEVFRLFSGIPGIPKLGPEDVEFVKGTTPSIDNLRLSESGHAKVYGTGEEDEPEVDVPAVDADEKPDDEGTSETLAPEVADGEEMPADEGTIEGGEESDEPKADDGPEGDEVSDTPEPEADDHQPLKVVAVKNANSSHYGLETPEGVSVLDELNDGKKVNGRTNVEALAEEKGFDVVEWRE